ncbi:Thoeris anti-defense Tad2 family protein [Rahnella sp. PCH160]|uniref:Thoeris anti-defense Tad2 family protein n=1 Tax=Rahnella sp. PCH160 TaxID=3447928 RepID=UPI0039FD2C0A
MIWKDAQAAIAAGSKIISARLGANEYVAASIESDEDATSITLFSPDGDLVGWRPSLSDQMSDDWEIS